MQSHFGKMNLKTVFCITLALLLGAGTALAQQVNLTAGATTLTLPDGSSVPMWGYSCDGTQPAGSTASCGALGKGAWSPVIITVQSGQDLQINLTNNLSFAVGKIPTSLVIVGQVGGGLGDVSQRTTTVSPGHSAQGATWPIVGAPDTSTQQGGDPNSAGNATFNPPPQGPRVQSFSTEVAAGATTSLTWKAPRPGTYLIESGTHPSIQGPMGLYGMLVVTTAPVGTTTAGIAYPAVGAVPAVTYNAEVPLLLSEIDPVQNRAVSTAVNTA